jgi:REP element-mobilizing transposase RayT
MAIGIQGSMRYRDYKESAPGMYYHAFNRGNAKQNIFVDDSDYLFFLLRLRQNLKPDGSEGRHFRPLPAGAFSLVAYCLMPNHFHFVIRQNIDLSTSALIGKLCTSYSMYFNKKYERVGHVFQDQFKQIPVKDDRYLLWLSAYVHLNPVKDGFADRVDRYRWSSIHEYLDRGADTLCDPGIVLTRFAGDPGQAYLDYLSDGFESENLGAPEM